MQPPQTQQQLQSLSPSSSTQGGPTTSQPGIVKVSLELPLLRADQLYPTPSMNDSLPFDVEFDLRLVGCELIQTSGRLLKLPQTAMATAQVIFHRFYYIKSFVKNSMEYHAMASIYLSSKIEESPRRIRDVLNVFHHIKQVRTGKLITPMAVDENYANTKNQVIKAERRILKELGFCVHVKHPHKIIFLYLQALGCAQSNLSQKAWNYMNDALRTDVFLRYSAEKIACACIYLSARELQIPLPESPPWYVIFGADEQSIKAICVRILHLYTHEVRTQDELEKLVQKCRDSIEAERALRNKLLLNTALAAAKEAAAQHLAKKSAATTAATATDSPSSTGTPTSTDKDATAAATKPSLTSTTSASSLLKSFEKTKSIHSSMSASGLNGNSTNSAATQQRPSPPNPYYLGNSSYHQHPHSHPHHLAMSASGRYPPHQNGHSNGNPSDVHMMPLAAENGGMPIRRDKSSSHLSSRYDEEYEQSKKRKDYSSKDIKHKNRSRTRSRSPSAKRKSRKKSRTRSRSRDRSNSVDIGEESIDLKSGSAASRHHKKKKSHHRRSSRSRSRTRSRSKEPSETTTKTDYRSESKKVGSGGSGRSEKDRDRERYDKERSRDKERSSDATKERKYYENSRHHSSKSIKS